MSLLVFPFLFNIVLCEWNFRENQDIGKALLPTSTNDKALPAPTENSPELATAGGTVLKAEATPEIVPETKVEAAAEATPEIVSETKVEASAEPAPEINSVPKTETKAESIPVQPKPLSPYPYVMS